MQDLAVPAVVRSKAEAAGAAPWLDALGDLVTRLVRDWSIRVGAAYRDATEAYVARATLADGTPAVLKLMIPRPGEHARHEITVLRLAGGQGCVRLLRADPARGALLLERLGRPLSELGCAIETRHEVLVTAARRVWRPAPDSGLPTGADKARWLAGFITVAWEDLGRPCSERAVDYALACAARRAAAHDDERAVLVHGDVHQWNTLRAPGGGNLLTLDNGPASPGWWNVLQDVLFVALALSLLVSLAGQAASYRRSSGERRQQLKWLLGGFAVGLVSAVVVVALQHRTGLWGVVSQVAILVPPG